jgi:hypothetical protein
VEKLLGSVRLSAAPLLADLILKLDDMNEKASPWTPTKLVDAELPA